MTLSYPDLLDLIQAGAIRHRTGGALDPQPASLDLPLDWSRVYRMPCSILPRPDESIDAIVQREALYRVQGDQLLELGHYYLVPTFLELAPIALRNPPPHLGKAKGVRERQKGSAHVLWTLCLDLTKSWRCWSVN